MCEVIFTSLSAENINLDEPFSHSSILDLTVEHGDMSVPGAVEGGVSHSLIAPCEIHDAASCHDHVFPIAVNEHSCALKIDGEIDNPSNSNDVAHPPSGRDDKCPIDKTEWKEIGTSSSKFHPYSSTPSSPVSPVSHEVQGTSSDFYSVLSIFTFSAFGLLVSTLSFCCSTSHLSVKVLYGVSTFLFVFGIIFMVYSAYLRRKENAESGVADSAKVASNS